MFSYIIFSHFADNKCIRHQTANVVRIQSQCIRVLCWRHAVKVTRRQRPTGMPHLRYHNVVTSPYYNLTQRPHHMYAHCIFHQDAMYLKQQHLPQHRVLQPQNPRTQTPRKIVQRTEKVLHIQWTRQWLKSLWTITDNGHATTTAALLRELHIMCVDIFWSLTTMFHVNYMENTSKPVVN